MDDREILIGRIKAAKWDAKICTKSGLSPDRRDIYLQSIDAQLESALKLIEEIVPARTSACIGIARQVCGHAYPDKTFDELDIGHIQLVQHNLPYADHTLAEIMPIVVEQA